MNCTVNGVHSQSDRDRTLQLIWGIADASTRGPQARFSIHDVTAAACEIADADGLPAVSLAKVAARLGLTTTALYRYVDSKDALLELMTDRSVGAPPALDDLAWDEAAHAWTGALWRRYKEHPWLTEVRVGGMPLHPGRLQWLESLLLALDRGPLADPMHTALLLDSLARAFAALEASSAADDGHPPDWLMAAVVDRFPRFAGELGRDWSDVEAELDLAVQTVLRAQ